MSIDFVALRQVQTNLATTIMTWRDHWQDGLFRSDPHSTSGVPPSYTCTAIVVQAMKEAGRMEEARSIAQSIIRDMFPSGQFSALPGEDKARSPHILNNSWALFALLDCLPTEVERFWPAAQWLIQSADSDGWWGLHPNDIGGPTDCPLFPAYAISALVQFLDCALAHGGVAPAHINEVQDAVLRGVSALLDRRVPTGGRADLFLWPDKLSNGNRSISFGTSAICAHVIDKASRLLKRPDLSHTVQHTLVELARALREHPNDERVYLDNTRVVLWETLHERSYHWTIFAPINLVTLLRHVDGLSGRQASDALLMTERFVLWTLTNMPVPDGSQGVYGSPQMQSVRVWAAAEALITISRVLRAEKSVRDLSVRARFSLRDRAIANFEAATSGAPPVSKASASIVRIGIFCALDEELAIMKSELRAEVFAEVPQYWRAEIGGVEFVLYSLKMARARMGRLAAAQETARFLAAVRPSKVIVAGIAGALRPKDGPKRGDILIPPSIIDLSSRKVAETHGPRPQVKGATPFEPEFRPQVFNVDQCLREFVGSAEFDGEGFLEASAAHTLKPMPVPKIYSQYPIVCVDEVVATEAWRSLLGAEWPEARGVEMESSGICAIAEVHGVGVCVVRGISDFAGKGKKDDRWRGIAMRNVARFLRCMAESESGQFLLARKTERIII